MNFSRLFLKLNRFNCNCRSVLPDRWSSVRGGVFCVFLIGQNQCSRLKSSYEFHYEGLSNFNVFNWRDGSNPRRQSKNIELKYKIRTKLVHGLCGTCFQYSAKNQESRIKHLTLIIVLTMPYACWFLWRADYVEDFKWRLHFQFGVAFWRVVLREVYFEWPNRVWRALKTSILNTRQNPSVAKAHRLHVDIIQCFLII